ncbi:MAG: hypothetical protein GWP10_21770 [Nitrospiraceae bacterium]|nr:hypothetical protein [Nitrospiraceae bacterium]
MSDRTLEKTHALLERLAEYVMTKIPKIEQKLDKLELEKADKRDIRLILDGMDAQAKQLDIIRTEQVATNAGLLRHEKRIRALEEKLK